MLHDSSSDCHAKDGFAGAAYYQDHFPTVFGGDAIGEGKTKSRTFLLSFADKWLEHAAADVLRDAWTVVLHFN